jgi:23S rRNA pseudouridine1911/1915/1917 synthase
MNYYFCVLSEKKIRVDIYLSTLFKDFSRSYIQKLIDSGNLELNGKILNKNKKIQNKDEIILKIKTEKLE